VLPGRESEREKAGEIQRIAAADVPCLDVPQCVLFAVMLT
jgi:hypothetical protein